VFLRRRFQFFNVIGSPRYSMPPPAPPLAHARCDCVKEGWPPQPSSVRRRAGGLYKISEVKSDICLMNGQAKDAIISLTKLAVRATRCGAVVGRTFHTPRSWASRGERNSGQVDVVPSWTRGRGGGGGAAAWPGPGRRHHGDRGGAGRRADDDEALASRPSSGVARGGEKSPLVGAGRRRGPRGAAWRGAASRGALR